MNRPIALIGAVALNVLIAVLCLGSGLLLVAAFLDGMHERVGISPRNAFATRAIIFGMPIYGALALIGAIATWRRSPPGWWLVLAVDLVGIAILVWGIAIGGADGLMVPLAILAVAAVLLTIARTQVAALGD